MEKLELTVERIDESSNALITNLFNLYMHDMAEWFLFDTEEDGRYGYDMAKHWARGDEIYIARCAGKLAGFTIVSSAKPFLNGGDGLDVEEFFLIRRYRHTGAGETLARDAVRQSPEKHAGLDPRPKRNELPNSSSVRLIRSDLFSRLHLRTRVFRSDSNSQACRAGVSRDSAPA